MPLSSHACTLQHALSRGGRPSLKEVAAEAQQHTCTFTPLSLSTLKTSLLLSLSACAAPRHQPERRRLSAHRRERALQELRHHRAHAAPADLAPHVEADARVVRGHFTLLHLHPPPSTQPLSTSLHSPPSTLHPPPSGSGHSTQAAQLSRLLRLRLVRISSPALPKQHSMQHSSTALPLPHASLTPSPPSCCTSHTHHRYYEPSRPSTRRPCSTRPSGHIGCSTARRR